VEQAAAASQSIFEQAKTLNGLLAHYRVGEEARTAGLGNRARAKSATSPASAPRAAAL
jgi:hypothetical protein